MPKYDAPLELSVKILLSLMPTRSYPLVACVHHTAQLVVGEPVFRDIASDSGNYSLCF